MIFEYITCYSMLSFSILTREDPLECPLPAISLLLLPFLHLLPSAFHSLHAHFPPPSLPPSHLSSFPFSLQIYFLLCFLCPLLPCLLAFKFPFFFFPFSLQIFFLLCFLCPLLPCLLAFKFPFFFPCFLRFFLSIFHSFFASLFFHSIVCLFLYFLLSFFLSFYLSSFLSFFFCNLQ